jgi:hypothetical protein
LLFFTHPDVRSYEFRIESAGSEFNVIDPRAVQVGRHATEQGAKKDMERCKREDGRHETAKQLVDTAMTEHVELFGIRREAASYWIRSAAETVE